MAASARACAIDPPVTSDKAPSATERAYVQTKERILDGRLRGGDLISEGDIAAAVGVSRTPVREAFLRLEAEGLLRLFPKRGALVVPVSAAEVEDVIETRLLIERFAIERIGRADDELRDRLEALLARQERLATKGDVQAFEEADRELHRLLVAATGNEILLSVHDSLRDRQSRMGLVALTQDTRRMRAILDEHRELVEALVAGDPAAGDMLGEHLGGTLVLLRAGRRTE